MQSYNSANDPCEGMTEKECADFEDEQMMLDEDAAIEREADAKRKQFIEDGGDWSVGRKKSVDPPPYTFANGEQISPEQVARFENLLDRLEKHKKTT